MMPLSTTTMPWPEFHCGCWPWAHGPWERQRQRDDWPHGPWHLPNCMEFWFFGIMKYEGFWMGDAFYIKVLELCSIRF